MLGTINDWYKKTYLWNSFCDTIQ